MPKRPSDDGELIDACRKKVADAKCGTLFRAYLQCSITNQLCDANGQDDGTAGGVCNSAEDALLACQ